MSRKSPDQFWVNFRVGSLYGVPRAWALGPYDLLASARIVRNHIETRSGVHSVWVADRLYAGRTTIGPHELSRAFEPPPEPIVADDLIVTAAFRYAIGRDTYIVKHIIDWVLKNQKSIPHETLDSMVNEVSEYLSRQLVRQRPEWERFLGAIVGH